MPADTLNPSGMALTGVSPTTDFREAARLARQKVLPFEIMRDRRCVTDGSATIQTVFTSRPFEGLGPYIESITGYLKGREVSGANYGFRIKVQKSYDGIIWEDFATALMPMKNANGTTVAVHTTVTDYGLWIRFAIEVQDAGATEEGTVSASVAIKFWS